MEIQLHRLTRRFPGVHQAGVVDLNLHIHSGEILAVVGPSGAGKSTLLRLIAGLEQVDSGEIHFDGRDLTHSPPHERNVGFVAQRAAIYPHLSVRRNIAIGLEMWQSRRHRERVSPAEISRRVDEAIDLLGLAGVLDRRPEELSGGEAQRVALGRLLVRRPLVWLLDEPLSHLDELRKMDFRGHLHLLHSLRPTTMILVTHDPVEALALGNRVAVLDAGRLRQVGAPVDLYDRPANRIVAERIGWPPLNLADGVLTRADVPGGNLRFAAADGSFHLLVPAELVTHGAEGQPVTVGIRAEDLVVTSPADSPLHHGFQVLPGWRLSRSEFVPPRWLVTATRGRTTWRAWLHAPPVGDEITLALPVPKLHWFDGQTGTTLTASDRP